MKIPIYQIDAFTGIVFKGNPAAVCILEEWLEDEVLQNIAAENNLAETAFIVGKNNEYMIRWFTPKVEIDLCGHATLAGAFALFEEYEKQLQTITFRSKSGPLTVHKNGTLLSMDFPSRKPVPCSKPKVLDEALGVEAMATFASRDLLVILETELQVKNLDPDLSLLSQLTEYFAVIVSSKGEKVDFVSRFFAPNAGILEDPVTGSSHCTLIPYWAEKLNKNKLHALQLSQRGGELFCENAGERVIISGKAVMYLKGHILL